MLQYITFLSLLSVLSSYASKTDDYDVAMFLETPRHLYFGIFVFIIVSFIIFGIKALHDMYKSIKKFADDKEVDEIFEEEIGDDLDEVDKEIEELKKSNKEMRDESKKIYKQLSQEKKQEFNNVVNELISDDRVEFGRYLFQMVKEFDEDPCTLSK